MLKTWRLLHNCDSNLDLFLYVLMFPVVIDCAVLVSVTILHVELLQVRQPNPHFNPLVGIELRDSRRGQFFPCSEINVVDLTESTVLTSCTATCTGKRCLISLVVGKARKIGDLGFGNPG